jgi:hypothetical protein
MMRGATLLLLLVAAPAFADASVPDDKKSNATSWSAQCVARFERARVDAEKSASIFRSAEVHAFHDGTTVTTVKLGWSMVSAGEWAWHYEAEVRVARDEDNAGDWAWIGTRSGGQRPRHRFSRRRAGLIGKYDCEGLTADRFAELFRAAIDECMAAADSNRKSMP